MSIDETELRSRLAATAALAGPLGFAAEDLAGRVRRTRRRLRRRVAIIAATSVTAAAAVALAVAIPRTHDEVSQGPMGAAASVGPRLSYTVTVNGQTRAVPAGTGAVPLFTVRAGERLTMRVRVTVPQPMTALWLGITDGVLSPRRGGPADMKPVLTASARGPLRPGVHRFVLHWTMPAGLMSGAGRELSVEWEWSGGEAEGDLAEFVVPLSATSPAAAAYRLRALALAAVRSCNRAGPVWIHAVRTNFSTAVAIPEIADGVSVVVGGADVVYLVQLKGDFVLHAGGRVPPVLCEHGPAGHYFTAVFDAATFVLLEEGVGDRQVGVPLGTLGSVLNLARSARG